MEFTIETSDYTPKPRGRQADENAEPNPFLTNGALKQSKESGTALKVTVPGSYEQVPVTRNEDGKRVPVTDDHGAIIMKDALRGDAARVVRWIREAADTFNYGVSVKDEQATRKNGSPFPGKVTVHFLVVERKKTTPKDKAQ